MLSGEYPIKVLCEAVDAPRSSFYYKSQREDDTQLRDEIEKIALEFPRYGYRRTTAELRRRGYEVSRKKTQRIMKEENLLVQVKGYCRTTFSQHGLGWYPNLAKGIEPERANQIWCGDITYIRLQREFVYLAVLMDIFTRGIRGWNISRTIDEELTLKAVEMALSHHEAPEIHHSDHGAQYASQRYVSLLNDHEIQISMAAIGRPTENAYAERLIRTLKEEEVYLNEYEDVEDATKRIGHFLDVVYMTKRVHSSLDYLTPAEFEQELSRQTHTTGTPEA